MRTANWRTALAALALVIGPALARADDPKPQPLPAGTVAPGSQRVIVIMQPTDCGPMQVVNGTVMTPGSGAAAAAPAAKPERNHPVWQCCKDIIHGPAYRMPVECASFKSEMTFLFGSCGAFYNQCDSPYTKAEKRGDRNGERGCNCGRDR